MVWMESFSWFFVAFTSFVKKQTTKWFKVNDLTICWLPKLVWTWVMLSNLIATFSLQRKLWLKRKEKKVKTKAGKNHSMTFYKVRRESVTRDRGKICMYREISTPKWTSFNKSSCTLELVAKWVWSSQLSRLFFCCKMLKNG